jgi:DNA-binding CsgD family transcriptional regulator/tetratricopeptide (TPR) repeat protein
VSDELLVGRGQQLEALHGLLAEVKAGVGGVVLVVGEQGVGKSTLLRAGLGGAEDQGCRLLWGVADELGQRMPLWLMSEIVGVAEGGSVGGGVMGGDAVAAGVERLLATVDRLCAESPVVLVVEDLQWADEASLLVWHRLSRSVSQLPLLLAGSCRPQAGAEVARLRRGVGERGGVVMDLDPLGDGEVRQLAESLAGGRPGRRLAGVMAHAGGNPLYARELVDGLVREGRVRVSGGVAELSGRDEVRVPASLAAAIQGRLGELAQDAVRVLRWGALLGTEFSVRDLEVVSGRSAGELMSVVDAAVGAGVLVEAGVRLGFRHGLIRQVLYEGMPAGLRAALHVQAARMLAGAGAAPERVAAQLAPAGLNSGALRLGADDSLQPVLRQEAGVPVDDWVVAWLADAAPVLIYRSPQVAEELLRAVLGQLPVGDRRRADLEASLVATLFRLERYEETAQAGERLLAGETDPQRMADTYWLVVYATLRTGRVEEARVQVAQALARPVLSESHKPRLLALQAITLGPTGQLDRTEAIARQALAGAEETGDRLAAGYALHALSVISFYRRDPVGRLEYISRALSVVEMDPQATDLQLLLLANKTFHLSNMDMKVEAIAAVRLALALAERAGTPRLQQLRYGLGNLHFDAGEWDDALAELEQASAVAGSADKRLEIYGMLALIAGRRNERETAARHLRAIGDVDLSVVHPSALYSMLLAKSLAAEQDGRLAEAIAVLADCFEPDLAERMPGVYYLAAPLARVALAGGDRETAAMAARLAEAESAHQPLPLRIAMTNHCRGLVAGDSALVLSAADYFQKAGRPFHWAQALEDAATIAAERGDLTAAQEHLTVAVSGYAGLGAAWNVEQASARLQRYGVRAARAGFRARPASGWEALTPTEVKVAYLVADGRSNPDVAAALFLSRNTVQTHVSHILAKLGARSRAEIIREAVRHPVSAHHAATA